MQCLFNWGKDREHQWRDAEEFVEFVDGSVTGSAAFAKLQRMIAWMRGEHSAGGHDKFDVPRFGDPRNLVRRALAAECTLFWKDVPTSGERWFPYRDWMPRLLPGLDTVVTFNYDGVLDCLVDPGRHAVILPGTKELPADKVPILKLHGSVDWLVKDRRCVPVGIEEALREQNLQLGIAIPGPSK